MLGDVNVQHCPLYFTSLDVDLLSLELEDALTDIYLHQDPTYIFLAANALMLLQKQLGLFPHIQGKGNAAKRLADVLLRMRAEDHVNAKSDPTNTYLSAFGMVPSSTVDSLVIIDRAVDFPTTLLTQLTYAGLIDETFGIRYNVAEINASVFGAVGQGQPAQSSSAVTAAVASTSATAKRKVQLDNTDKLYPDLRDSNFAVVGSQLSKTARRLQADYETRHKADQSISDLKTFVAKLPSYQAEQASLKTHTAIAEEVMKVTRTALFGRTLEIQQSLAAGSDTNSLFDDIEELIARDTPLPTIIRLLCLKSTLYNGIRARDLDAVKHSIIHAYGPQHLLTFARLEKMGLLTTRAPNTGYLNPIASAGANTATDYNSVRKTLKLFLDDVDEAEPKDIAYAFSGYAPLSVRLVQCALQKGFLADLAPPARSVLPTGATAAAFKKPFSGLKAGGDKSENSSAATVKSGSSDAASVREPSKQNRAMGWKPFEDVLGRIKGATFHHVQRPDDPDASRARVALRGNGGGADGQQRAGMTSIVFFLGGITYAEIAALRLVAKQLESQQKRKLIIATTGIISGDRVVGAAIEKRTFTTQNSSMSASD